MSGPVEIPEEAEFDWTLMNTIAEAVLKGPGEWIGGGADLAAVATDVREKVKPLIAARVRRRVTEEVRAWLAAPEHAEVFEDVELVEFIQSSVATPDGHGVLPECCEHGMVGPHAFPAGTHRVCPGPVATPLSEAVLGPGTIVRPVATPSHPVCSECGKPRSDDPESEEGISGMCLRCLLGPLPSEMESQP